MNRFKTNLRDFLIQLREFSGDAENAELFLEDKEAAAEAKKQEERARAAAVPGMLKCVPFHCHFPSSDLSMHV